MNLHEYQAKQLLAARGVAVPRGSVCYDPLEALIGARALKTDKVVLKAQVHTGGRGKAGGVIVLSMDEDVRGAAARILSKPLVTNQTGPEGKPISALLVEEVLPVDQEMYLGVILDRLSGWVTIMASAEGGVEIEKLAKGLGVSIERLTQNPAHKGFDVAKDGPVHMTQKERRIWDLYKKLPRDHWKRKAIDELLITHRSK